jgi:small ligand-binding sensory domain FIST
VATVGVGGAGGEGRVQLRDRMCWASALSEEPDPEGAAAAVVAAARRALGETRVDLAVVFCTATHFPVCDRIGWAVRQALPDAVLVGCTGASVIGAGQEVEGRTALSLTVARLPGVALRPMRVAGDGFPRGTASWSEHFELAAAPAPHFVLLADPFTCDAEALVEQLDSDFPDSTVVGGIASGGRRPGENALLLGDRVHTDGLVGLALQGDVQVESIVAQGCRPIGHPMFVTRLRGQRLVEVDGRPPMEALRSLYQGADARDRALIQSSLFLGIEMRPELTAYGPGDFLIRNLVGADEQTGALVVAAPLREGQVVQFHLRDARTSAEDLEVRLARYGDDHAGLGPPSGALLFSCLGRGTGLYGVPNHDSDSFQRHLGPAPLGGFFGNGEIGPVERRTFLHGYTSAFALFRPRLG